MRCPKCGKPAGSPIGRGGYIYTLYECFECPKCGCRFTVYIPYDEWPEDDKRVLHGDWGHDLDDLDLPPSEHDRLAAVTNAMEHLAAVEKVVDWRPSEQHPAPSSDDVYQAGVCLDNVLAYFDGEGFDAQMVADLRACAKESLDYWRFRGDLSGAFRFSDTRPIAAARAALEERKESLTNG